VTIERAQSDWAEVLRRLQAEYGTYAKIGVALGVHENSVQGWITQGRLPDRGTERRIAGRLGLDPARFHQAIDQLREEQFLQRLRQHPLAPEVEPSSKLFPRAEAPQPRPTTAPTGRGARRPRPQRVDRRRPRA
jgi:hypothetical protein